MATKSQNITFDESVIDEVIAMSKTDNRNKSNMFNVLVREALEARYEAGFEQGSSRQQSNEEGA